MRKVTKLFTSKALSIDEESKTVRFKISDDKPDRMGEIVKQDFDLTSYKANPIILWGHDPSEPENVLGTGSVEVGLSESYADISFASDINSKAALVWEMVKAGVLRCVSVGFIPHSYEMEDDTPVLAQNELLEISIVPIPANPRAIALSYKAGEISKKDATFLQESMQRELGYLEEQMKDNDEVETKDLKDVEEKIATLTDLVGKLGEQVSTISADVRTLSEAVQAKQDDKTETDEERQAREAQEAADAAKGGDNDQSGAAEDDIDLDAELTPELEEQIEAELAEDAA